MDFAQTMVHWQIEEYRVPLIKIRDRLFAETDNVTLTIEVGTGSERRLCLPR
jgi:hypothetical protein